MYVQCIHTINTVIPGGQSHKLITLQSIQIRYPRRSNVGPKCQFCIEFLQWTHLVAMTLVVSGDASCAAVFGLDQ